MGQKPDEISIQFERGLRTRGSILSGDDALLTMDNVWLSPDDFGALQRVRGFGKVETIAESGDDIEFYRLARVAKSDGTVRNLVSYLHNSTKKIVFVGNETTKTSVWISSSTPALTGVNFAAAVLNDLVFMVNGVDAPAKWDFTTLSAAGVGRPDITDATITLNAGGNDAVIGVVRYFISQITATVEGALSVAIPSASGVDSIDCGNGNRVDINLTHANYSGKEYYIYRTQANEGTPYFLAKLAGGSTFTDDKPDRDLGSSPFLNGDPPLAAFIDLVVWNDRLWGLTKDGRLFWSDPENAESWATADDGNFIPVNEDDGDFGVALVRDPSGLLVIKEDHTYRILGTPPDSLEVKELTLATQEGGSLGAATKTAITGIDQGIALVWRKAVYIILANQVQDISSSIRDDLNSIREGDEEHTFLGFHKARRLLYVSLPITAPPSGESPPSHTYVFSLDRGEWIGRMVRGFRGFLSTFDAGSGAESEQFWGLSTDNSGIIYWMNFPSLASERSFDGAAIVAEALLRPFLGRRPSALKQFLYVDVHFVPQSSGTITLDAIIDGKTASPISTSVSMVESGHDTFRRRVNIGEYGHELQLKITSNTSVDDAWLIPRLSIGWQEYESDPF